MGLIIEHDPDAKNCWNCENAFSTNHRGEWLTVCNVYEIIIGRDDCPITSINAENCCALSRPGRPRNSVPMNNTFAILQH